MDEQTRGFRSAIFGGFNREDVMHYIEETDTKYYTETAELRSQLTEAQSAMNELRTQNEALTAKNAELILQISCHFVNFLADIYSIFNGLVYDKCNLWCVAHIHCTCKFSADISLCTLKTFDRIFLCFLVSENTDICLACLKIRCYFNSNNRCQRCNTWIFDPATQDITQLTLYFCIDSCILNTVLSHVITPFLYRKVTPAMYDPCTSNNSVTC